MALVELLQPPLRLDQKPGLKLMKAAQRPPLKFHHSVQVSAAQTSRQSRLKGSHQTDQPSLHPIKVLTRTLCHPFPFVELDPSAQIRPGFQKLSFPSWINYLLIKSRHRSKLLEAGT